MNIIPFAALDVGLYDTGNKQRAYEKDGAQQAITGFLLSRQITFLQTQLGRLGYRSFGAAAVVTVFAIIRLAIPMLVRPLIFWKAPNAYKKFEAIWKPIQKGIDFVFDRASMIFNVACIVSYVALIALGHVAVGALGLAMVMVLTLKQFGYLPAIADKILTPLSIVCSAYGAAIANIFIVFKIVQVLFSGLDLVNYLSKFEMVASFLARIGVPGTKELQHIVEKGSEPVIKYPGNREFDDLPFTLNPTHVHAKEVSQILSNETLADCGKYTFKQLFDGVRDRHEQLKTMETPEKWSEVGFSRLRISMETGRTTDVTTLHFNKTREIIKATLIRIYTERDEREFIKLAREFSTIGEACVEGWTRESSFLLNRKSKDPRWAIHNLLANFRGEIAEGGVAMVGGFLVKEPQIQKIAPDILNAFGGMNNVHLNTQLAGWIYRRWRTARGEMNKQMNGEGIIGKLCQANVSIRDSFKKDMKDLANKKISWRLIKEAMFASYEIVLPLPVPPILLGIGMHEALKRAYTTQIIIERLRDAIQPHVFEYQHDLDDTGAVREEVTRELPWEAITAWIGDLNERIEKTYRKFTIIDDDEDFDRNYVRPGTNILTNNGVGRLRLRDKEGGYPDEAKVTNPDGSFNERYITHNENTREYSFTDEGTQLILEWERKDKDKIKLHIFDEDGNYNHNFVRKDRRSDELVLTDAGIKLLLWDLGIIQVGVDPIDDL